MAEVRLLGSGGYIPTDQRETCCALMRSGDRALVSYAGTGLRRLVTERQLLEGVEHLDLVLTHFHLDHVVGLGYLSGVPGPAPVGWAPGEALYRTSGGELLARLFADPLLPTDLADAGNVDLARGVRVLCHEAWFSEDAPEHQESHSSGRQVPAIVREAGVDRLVLIHLNPTDATHDAVLAEARAGFADTVLGDDRLVLWP